MTDYVVETVNLCRDFGDVHAVNDVSMRVSKGTILAVLGPNGAGKTTLMRLLMGLLEPTAGQGLILGDPLRRQATPSRVAYMGDGHEPPRWATPAMLEALQVAASPRFSRPFFRRLLSERELSPSWRYGELSKGQKRWVLAAAAFASGADLLLLDEPADGMDPAARRSMYDYLRKYANQAEASALVTTHIIGDIERVADEVAIIDRGRLVLHASVEDLREQVRHVELSGQGELPDLPDAVRVLGAQRLGNSCLAWLRCQGVDDGQLQGLLGPRASLRNATLEEIYMAIVETGGARELAATREA